MTEGGPNGLNGHYSGRRPRGIFSLALEDGRLVEALYRPEDGRTLFAVWDSGSCEERQSFETNGERLVPYSPGNTLLQHGVVLLPAKPTEYGTTRELLAQIQEFIHRFVDVSETFERLAAHYVLLTWIYDGFNELPYLRVCGDPGSGKTRFLQVVGSLCYKAIFASGASTVSPIFRILDIVRGTLVMDESDFRVSDERAEIVKILNNGNARGFPVLRSELVGRCEYSPQAYTVFGPKIVATRGFFEDRALESRCVTENVGRTRVRRDIPITLPPEFRTEALALRNQLLMYRFRNYGQRSLADAAFNPGVEARVNQVFGPLLAMIEDGETAEAFSALMRKLNHQHIVDRGMDTEGHILEVLSELMATGVDLTIKEITDAFRRRYGDEYDNRVTRRWIGWILRRKLLLSTHKTRGVFVIPAFERPALKRLFERYGIGSHGGRCVSSANAKSGPLSPPNPIC